MTTVTITTAVSLSAASLQKVKQAVEKKYGKDLVFVEQVDPEVVGGIKLRINSMQFDATVAHKLDQLQHQLLHITA